MTNDEIRSIQALSTELDNDMPVLLTDGRQLLDDAGNPIDMLALIQHTNALRSKASELNTLVMKLQCRPEKAKTKPPAKPKRKAAAKDKSDPSAPPANEHTKDIFGHAGEQS